MIPVVRCRHRETRAVTGSSNRHFHLKRAVQKMKSLLNCRPGIHPVNLSRVLHLSWQHGQPQLLLSSGGKFSSRQMVPLSAEFGLASEDLTRFGRRLGSHARTTRKKNDLSLEAI
jgi:hypothetical protein